MQMILVISKRKRNLYL